MKLNDLKIGVRLAALAGALLVSTVVVGGVALVSLKADQAQFEASHVTADDFERAIDSARAAQVQFKVQIQEWKNLLLRGGDPAAFDKYSKAFSKEGDEVRAKLENLKKLFVKLNLPTGNLDEAQSELTTLTTKYNAALAHYDKANPDKSAHEVDALVKGMDRPPTKRIDAIVEATLKA